MKIRIYETDFEGNPVECTGEYFSGRTALDIVNAMKMNPFQLNIEEELKKFLKDARLNIDNNPAERLNRGIAIIRKNCLFAGSGNARSSSL